MRRRSKARKVSEFGSILAKQTSFDSMAGKCSLWALYSRSQSPTIRRCSSSAQKWQLSKSD